MTPRIQPATPPFDPEVGDIIDRTMKGRPPLHLFATIARDPRLAKKFFAGGLLDKGHLTLRQREIIIDRTTALCGSEYEWGVHVATFGDKAGLTPEQIHSTVRGTPEDECWSEEDRLLLRLCDALHRDCDVDGTLWQALGARFAENAVMEMLMLAGFYRTVSYLTNALRMPLETGGARFPA
jgi:alkylhydroperoxidase family enzyme